MTIEISQYELWVNWDEHIASLQQKPGFESVTFFSRENLDANLRILQQSGFEIT